MLDTPKLAGGVRVVGGLAALYVAATGKAPGVVRAGLGVAALAMLVTAWGDLTA